MGRKVLLCLPYAGGASYIYHGWKRFFQKQNIEIKSLEYPGRGSRTNEPFSHSLEELVVDLYEQVRSDILLNDYAFFGHSMGSLLAYELANKIEKEQLPRPEYLFLSGSNTPWNHDRNNGLHLLSDAAFLKEIQKLGGIPKEVSSHPELLEMIIPILKSDFKLLAEHHFALYKLNTPIVCLNGENDYNEKEIEGWKMATSLETQFYNFPGGHFYINENNNLQEIFKIISSQFSLKSIGV